MTLRSLARRAALTVPPLRRFYRHASGLSLQHDALQGEIAELTAALDQAYDALEVERSLVSELTIERDEARSTLEAERANVKGAEDEHESLKLQVYVLRSDFQRSVAQVDKLRTAAQAETKRLEKITLELEAARAAVGEAERQCAELRAQAQQRDATERDLTRRLEAAKQAERECAELRTQVQSRDALEQNLTRRLAEAEARRSAELEQSQARLLGRMSLVSADMLALRQVIRANPRGDVQRTDELRQNYLELLEAALTGRLFEDASIAPWVEGYDPEVRTIGRDWPSLAQTMIGTVRMRNIRTLAERLFEDGIAGDFLEAGVWRGGACIYMRGILAAYSCVDRKVFVADSFEGLPKPTPELYPADTNDAHHTYKELVASLEEVKGNFARYGLLDNQVVFLKGWFKDTLHNAPTQKLALLRLDGDMYSSTIEALEALYSRVAPGGFVVIDDYILQPCRQAVEDFRSRFRIIDTIEEIDGAGVFWRKTA